MTTTFTINGMNLYQIYDESGERTLDDTVYDMCCGEDNLDNHGSTEDLCHRFLQQKPVSTCQNADNTGTGKMSLLFKVLC